MSGCDAMAIDRQLLESLAGRCGSKVLILGVGNTLKGDDAAGPLVCERLSGRLSAVVLDVGVTPENYVGPILKAHADVLLIVDAVDFGGTPGVLRIFEPSEIREFAFSTHALSLHLFIETLQRDRPFDVRVIGIQTGSRQLGDGVSPAVQQAVETLADTLQTLLPPPAQP
jgi:hydrogenase 3 maturation protease